MQALGALFVIFGLSDTRLNAQGILKSVGGTSPSAPSTSPLSYELDAESSFFGRGAANAGSKNVGNITEITSSAKFVLSAQVRDTALLRLGVGWLGYFFNPEPKAPIPDSLQAENLEVGADMHGLKHFLESTATLATSHRGILTCLSRLQPPILSVRISFCWPAFTWT
jgi:hypothetical protein